MVGGAQPGIIPVLQGRDSGSLAVRVGFLGAGMRDDTGDGGNPHGVLKADYSEADKAAGRWDLRYTDDGGGSKGGRDEVGG